MKGHGLDREKIQKYILRLDWQNESETFLSLLIQYSDQQSEGSNFHKLFV